MKTDKERTRAHTAHKGIFIPPFIARLWPQTINAEEMLLLNKLYTMQDRKNPEKKGACWAGNERLAQEWGNKSEDWVSRTISKFEELGLIEVEIKRKGRKKTERRIWTTLKHLEKTPSGALGENSKQQYNTSYCKRGTPPRSSSNSFLDVKHSAPESKNMKAPEKTDVNTTIEKAGHSKFARKYAPDLIEFVESTTLPEGHEFSRHHKDQFHTCMDELLQEQGNDKPARLRIKRVLKSLITVHRHLTEECQDKELHQYMPRIEKPFDFKKKFTAIKRWVKRNQTAEDFVTVTTRKLANGNSVVRLRYNVEDEEESFDAPADAADY